MDHLRNKKPARQACQHTGRSTSYPNQEPIASQGSDSLSFYHIQAPRLAPTLGLR